MTERARDDRWLLPAAELALLALTLAAAAGLGRALADWSFLATTAVLAVTAHAIAGTCRRLGLSGAATGVVSLVLIVPVLALVHAPATTTFLLPTSETMRLLSEELREGWAAFGQVRPPAPVLPGFVVALAVATWFLAFSADAAAFRARASLESLVPAAGLFIFGAALDGTRARVPVTAVFFATLLAAWLTQQALERTASATWMARNAGRSAAAMFRVGGGLALLGVAASVLLGPRLPGAQAEPIVPWRASDRDQGSSRVTVSPLVDIRTRIVNEADQEVFLVRSPVRSYWRLTSLERFDGRIWSSNRSYGRARGRLGTDVDTSAADATSNVAEQTFQIQTLASIWLPAAFRPTKLSGTDARYDADSNSLLTEQETASGAAYTVESAIPRLTAAQLQEVVPAAPASVAATYLDLPDGFSPAAQRLALRVSAGASTQYERAKALQDFFRGGLFTYDLDVPPGHGANALEQFLFETRRGYCEQFAGAFAAMARAIRLPARVAVGFTSGEPDDAGILHVRGRNGHAWPEVYFQGYGWVAFEPTPGRGIPGAQAYTLLPEQQASANDPGTATTLAPTTTAPASTARPATTETTLSASDPQAPSSGGGWWRPALVVVTILLTIPTVWSFAVTGLRRRRREHRRRAALSSNERVLVSWAEVDEALQRTGHGRQSWETPIEYARRAAGQTMVDSALLAELARATSAAAYGRAALADALADDAMQAAAMLEEAADKSLDRRGRLRLLFDPRPLLPARDARVEVRETAGSR